MSRRAYVNLWVDRYLASLISVSIGRTPIMRGKVSGLASSLRPIIYNSERNSS